jgi:hypothetical protein
MCSRRGATPSNWKVWLGFSPMWVQHMFLWYIHRLYWLQFICGKEETKHLFFITSHTPFQAVVFMLSMFVWYLGATDSTCLYTWKTLLWLNMILSKEWLTASSTSQINYINAYLFPVFEVTAALIGVCKLRGSVACTVDYGMLSSKLACLNNVLGFHKKLWCVHFSCFGAPGFPTSILLNCHSLWSCQMDLSSYWCIPYTCLNLQWTWIINSNSSNHKIIIIIIFINCKWVGTRWHCVFCWKLTIFPEWQSMWLWSQHKGNSVGRIVPYEGHFEFGRKTYVVGFNVSTAANI